jgi:hypothetical protein
MLNPLPPYTEQELEEWHKAQMERIARLHEEVMARFAYLKTPEYAEEVRRQILDRTHAPITPPWEE